MIASIFLPKIMSTNVLYRKYCDIYPQESSFLDMSFWKQNVAFLPNTYFKYSSLHLNGGEHIMEQNVERKGSLQVPDIYWSACIS